jgi:shikimate dehydrogenase
MDRYAVIGHPVEHSRSPDIQACFAAQTGQSIDYTRLLSPLDGFPATVRQFAADGAHGCNVTVPFKFEAWQLAPCRTPRAQRAEAANTLRFDADGWWCDNTDGIGLVRDITVNAGVVLAGRRVLLIGAGGAAAGVLGPLIEAGPSALVVANRTADKAQTLVDRHADLARDHGVALSVAPLDTPGTAFDIVINGTASSLAGAGVPVSGEVLRPDALALDMMYGAGAQPFLDWAARHGATGRDGLGMLVEQAAESFFAWRGVRPDTAPVLAVVRAQVDGAR